MSEIADAVMLPMNFKPEPGWIGIFTRDQAPGAIPNGTKIVKAVREAGDTHDVGARGTVLGSYKSPGGLPGALARIKYWYFIEWDDNPKAAVGTVDFKVAILQ